MIRSSVKDTDSDEVRAMIEAAAAKIENTVYDESKTLEENETPVMNALLEDANAIRAQRRADAAAEELRRNAAAFEDYKAEQIAALEAMKENYSARLPKEEINQAIKLLQELQYDVSKTPAENSGAIDAVVEELNTALSELDPEEEQPDYPDLFDDPDSETWSFEGIAGLKKLDMTNCPICGKNHRDSGSVVDTLVGGTHLFLYFFIFMARFFKLAVDLAEDYGADTVWHIFYTH